MVCPACGNPSRGLCRRCSLSLAPAPIRMVCGVAVVGGYAHRGAAVSLVHRMKYRRDRSATRVLVERMASIIDTEPVALVPIPRAWVRRVRYGIDPALALATGLSAHMGIPLVESLDAPIWMSPHTGKAASVRFPRAFDVRRRPPDGSMLVDDVLTSGSTIAAALAAIGEGEFLVATATTAGTMR